ncbi:MAG: hypothetical protein O3B80_01945 [Proteobacteria bacterium]|nr:hypothetical protein [Pseudomonadota bacterium]
MKIGLKFDDKKIEAATGNPELLDFSYQKKDKHTGELKIRIRDRLRLAFDVPKKSKLKGLYLVVYKPKISTNQSLKRNFYVRYWFNGAPKDYFVGTFIPGIFGVREVEEILTPLVAEHTNHKGYWIKDPNLTQKQNKVLAAEEQIETAQQKTINEVIEELIEANIPKVRQEGTLTAGSAKETTMHLCGYNWRTKHFYHSDDKHGNGRIELVASYSHTRAAKPESFKALFLKFPAGKGLIKSNKLNKLQHISIYDSEIGQSLVSNLNTGRITRWLNSNRHSYGVKKHTLNAFKSIWHFANTAGYLGDNPGMDPTLTIKLKKPAIKDRSINSKYNDQRFTLDQVQKIRASAINQSTRYPFQAELIRFISHAAQRYEECSKLKKDNIAWFQEPKAFKINNETRYIYGKIIFPAGITKRRKEKFIFITDGVKQVLDDLEQIYSRPGLEAYKFIPWLFPSIKIAHKQLVKRDPAFMRSDKTRCRAIKHCWNAIRQETGIQGAIRLFRKTLVSVGANSIGLERTKFLSNHDNIATMDPKYHKGVDDEVMQDAVQVAEILDFPKKAI